MATGPNAPRVPRTMLSMGLMIILVSALSGCSGKIRYEYFQVYGDDWGEISESVRKLGPQPSEDDVGVTHIWGRTEFDTRTEWSYWQRDGWCEPSTTRLRVSYTVTLPEWDPPPEADAALRTRWRNVVKSVRAHELEHVRIAEAGIAEMRRELRNLGHFNRCQAMSRQVNRMLEDMAEDLNEQHEIFDDREMSSPLWQAFDRAEMDEAYEEGGH